MITVTPILDSIELKNITDEDYFSEKYSNCISNSKLSLINPDEGGSFEKYSEGLSKNHKFSSSLTFGSAVHAFILEPDKYILNTKVNRPTAKLGDMADYLYKIYKEGSNIDTSSITKASDEVDYYKGKMNEDRVVKVIENCKEYWKTRKEFEDNYNFEKTPIYLDPKSRERLNLCLDSVNHNKDIHNILYPDDTFSKIINVNENTLFMDIMVSDGTKNKILKIKAKLDNLIIKVDTGEIILNDLKTTGHKLIDFKYSFYKYHYYRQMSLYLCMLVAYATKITNQISSITSNMLLVSSIPDYRAGIFKVNIGHLNKGMEELRKLLKLVGEFELNGGEI